jgi:hypothetical protein
MKFWQGNRIDGEFDMPVSEVAAQFAEWFSSQPQADRMAAIPMERHLRYWLTSSEHFNSVWEAEQGDESFAGLLDCALGLVYGRGEPDYSVNHLG